MWPQMASQAPFISPPTFPSPSLPLPFSSPSPHSRRHFCRVFHFNGWNFSTLLSDLWIALGRICRLSSESRVKPKKEKKKLRLFLFFSSLSLPPFLFPFYCRNKAKYLLKYLLILFKPDEAHFRCMFSINSVRVFECEGLHPNTTSLCVYGRDQCFSAGGHRGLRRTPTEDWGKV